MKRSRVTLAITDAAAIAADVRVAADDRALVEARGRDREAVGQAQRAGRPPRGAACRDSAARLVLCSPRSSIPRTQREVTATRDGRAQDAGVELLAHLRACAAWSRSARTARAGRERQRS